MVTLIEKIIEHVLGKKYWLVTLRKIEYSKSKPGSEEDQDRSVSNFIFRNKDDATEYFYQMRTNRTYCSIEIVSFRSREFYKPFSDDWKK